MASASLFIFVGIKNFLTQATYEKEVIASSVLEPEIQTPNADTGEVPYGWMTAAHLGRKSHLPSGGGKTQLIPLITILL